MYMNQEIITITNEYEVLDALFETHESVFVVCGKSIRNLNIYSYLKKLEQKCKVIYFHDFQPNPTYESVVEGVQKFRQSNAKLIVAIGGGSAMDVAKCIKLFCNMNDDHLFLEQTIIPNNVHLIAMPTTAGTGSESTKFAVIYYNGVKQSVTDESIIPSKIIFDSSALKTLPYSVRCSSMLDALSHAIESYWSINSTNKSKSIAKDAIQMILKYKDQYLKNTDIGNAQMLKAANLAGQAINITQTTAGHAMCYKLTSLYSLQHGYATALVNVQLWPWMVDHIDDCADIRGKEYLKTVFCDLSEMFGGTTMKDGIECYKQLVNSLISSSDISVNESDYNVLCSSVNQKRLKNNPIKLDEQSICDLYYKILGGRK